MATNINEAALERVKLLGGVVEQYYRQGVVIKSVNGIGLCELSDSDKQAIEHFKQTYGGEVIHVIESYHEFGRCLNLLCVSKYPEDWFDIDDYKHLNKHGTGGIFCYVVNLDCERLTLTKITFGRVMK